MHWSVFIICFINEDREVLVLWDEVIFIKLRIIQNRLQMLLNPTTTPCGLTSVRFERFLTSKFETKITTQPKLKHQVSTCENLYHHTAFLLSFLPQSRFSLYIAWIKIYGSSIALTDLWAGFTPHYFNLLKVLVLSSFSVVFL